MPRLRRQCYEENRVNNTLFERFPALEACRIDIEAAAGLIINCYQNEGKLLLCGNGGSAADCDHIVGELMKGFLKKRPLSDAKKAEMKRNCPEIPEEDLLLLQDGLPAVALPSSASALSAAFCNDVSPDLVYSQQLYVLGGKNDILIAISTSGNSGNVYKAALTAKALGIKVISLTGKGGGKLAGISDVCIKVPENETYKIQELHLPVYHALCAEAEEYFFAI